MKHAFCKSAVFVLFLLFAVSSFTAAQTLERGAIHGFVYDTSGSAVPGVKITLTSTATGSRCPVIPSAGPGAHGSSA